MISFCTFIKNESNCIEGLIESVQLFVEEIIIVVDTSSTDNTLEICNNLKKQNPKIKVSTKEFTNFADMRNHTASLANESWILMLDADERLQGIEHLHDVIWYRGHAHFRIDKYSAVSNNEINAFAFPRKRWISLDITDPKNQIELEAYPDYQVRLFRKNCGFIWRRELHEFFDGTAVWHTDELFTGNYPIIHHFHDVFKSPERLQERSELYTKLAAQAGVTIEGGHKV